MFAIIAIIVGMTQQLDPARTVISKIGGPQAVSRITGKSLTRVYRWMYPNSKGGTGGVIPHDDARKLLEHAASNGLDLTPSDFFTSLTPERIDPMTERASNTEAAA